MWRARELPKVLHAGFLGICDIGAAESLSRILHAGFLGVSDLGSYLDSLMQASSVFSIYHGDLGGTHTVFNTQ